MGALTNITDILIPSDETLAAVLGTAKKPVQSEKTAPEIKDVSELVNKTAFLSVKFGIIGNSRKVSGAAVLNTDADKALLRVSKTLIESQELESIRSADGKLRAYLYNTCLPWDLGVMMLPKGLVVEVTERMEQFKIEREGLVELFLTAYPERIETASVKLGSLHNLSDYLSVEEARSKFYFEFNWVTFGVSDTLKTISSELYKKEEKKIAAQMNAAAGEITQVMREKMLELVSHLEDRLKPTDEGKKKVLRESPVSNLQEFLSKFAQYNVTNDVALAELVERAHDLIGGTSAKTLSSSDEWREKIRSGMESIKGQLSGMVEDKAGRKFRDE